MNRIITTILFSLIFSVSFSQATNIREVIIIAGQSNADGRNDGVPSVAEADSTMANIQMYNYVSGTIGQMEYGVNAGAFTNTSVSFGFDAFALAAWRDSVAETIYVLKATRGGTSMSATENTTGSWDIDGEAVANHSSTQSIMAYQLKERMERVRIINARDGYVTRFKCVLWHQGESDAGDPHDDNYQANMTAFIAQVRKWAWDSTLPFIMGTVPTNSSGYSATVKAAMQAIDAADANVHLIDLGSRTLMDAFHWNATEAEAIGLLYYNKMTEIY